MAKIGMTQSQVESVISELNELNDQFRTAVTALESKQQELAGEWQGDANTSFNQAFQNDKGKWDSFAKTVETYISVLTSIKNNMSTSEQLNKDIASKRTY